MFESTIYMIRNGDFGSNFESKFFIALAGLIFVLYFWLKKKNTDYLWVFLIGTVIWSLVEFTLQYLGVRQFNEVTLFGSVLLHPIVAILRGASEGGFVALFGIYFGDLILKKETRILGIIYSIALSLLLVFISFKSAISFKDIGGEVASRRDIFIFPSLLATGIMTFGSLIWAFFVSSTTRRRALALIGVMILVTGIWTIAQVIFNLRWVEVSFAGGFIRAPFWTEFWSLFYDVVFEIGFVYVPFFAIPCFFKLIKN